MYNECSAVLHAVEPLLVRANTVIDGPGVSQDNVLSIEGQTRRLAATLARLNAGPVEDKDIGEVRSALQCGYMLKKYRFGGDPKARAAAAIAGFRSRNAVCGNTTDPWMKANIQREMRRLLKRALPIVEQWRPRFGHGSVAEHVPWLARWERITTYPFLHQGALLPVTTGLSLHGGDSVRLCAVPKDWDKDRLITVEPWLNTFVQHATRQLIYESIHAGPLRNTALDALYVDSVWLHRKLTVEGSQGKGYATFDLKDASDLISLADVEAVFPPWVLAWLTSCRTPFFTEGGKSSEEIRMYAGMGNATTFVVESLYFWAAWMAIARISGVRNPFVSVWGDDVICDEDTAAICANTQLIEMLGLALNRHKSFWGNSSFRESCGMWALRGQTVTPSRFDGFDLDTLLGRVGFADVIRKFSQSGCAMQLMMADRLVRKASAVVKVSSLDIPGSQYVHDAYGLWTALHETLDTRLNKDLHVLEAKVEMPRVENVRVPPDRIGYLYGALLGQVTTEVCKSGPDKGLSFILLPKPTGSLAKKRWVALSSFPVGVHCRIDG